MFLGVELTDTAMSSEELWNVADSGCCEPRTYLPYEELPVAPSGLSGLPYPDELLCDKG